jgi:dolichyl-phosphate-mannose--protein O-mannosyl transferase
MSFEGLIIGMMAFATMGVFHPIIIKSEYYFTDKIWPIYLIVGLISIALSCFIPQRLLAAFFGIWGCTSLWSIHELKKQTDRVKKGWFPENPKRAAMYTQHVKR